MPIDLQGPSKEMTGKEMACLIRNAPLRGQAPGGNLPTTGKVREIL